MGFGGIGWYEVGVKYCVGAVGIWWAALGRGGGTIWGCFFGDLGEIGIKNAIARPVPTLWHTYCLCKQRANYLFCEGRKKDQSRG